MHLLQSIHINSARVCHIYIVVGALYCKLCCIHWRRRLYYAILSGCAVQLKQETLPPLLDGQHGAEHRADGLVEHGL